MAKIMAPLAQRSALARIRVPLFRPDSVVDQSTTAVIDSYTSSQLNQPQYRGFGHGTMVSAWSALLAPGALIMH